MSEDLLDIREAALLTGRHPETVRRWVWSGRLRRHSRGRRLLVERAELVALCGLDRASGPTLAQWRDRARAFRAESIDGRAPRSAADLVIADRSERR